MHFHKWNKWEQVYRFTRHTMANGEQSPWKNTGEVVAQQRQCGVCGKTQKRSLY